MRPARATFGVLPGRPVHCGPCSSSLRPVPCPWPPSPFGEDSCPRNTCLTACCTLADTAWIAWPGLVGVLIGGTGFAWLAIAFVHRIFLRREPDAAVDRTHRLHPPAATMVAGPMALTAIGFTLPLTLDNWFQPLVQGAVSAIAGEDQSVHVPPVGRLQRVLLLSLAALAAGTGLYLLGNRMVRVLHRATDRVPSGTGCWKGSWGWPRAGLRGFPTDCRTCP